MKPSRALADRDSGAGSAPAGTCRRPAVASPSAPWHETQWMAKIFDPGRPRRRPADWGSSGPDHRRGPPGPRPRRAGWNPAGAFRASASGWTAGCCSMLGGPAAFAVARRQRETARDAAASARASRHHLHTASPRSSRTAVLRSSAQPCSGTTIDDPLARDLLACRRGNHWRVKAERMTSALKLTTPAKSIVSSNMMIAERGPGDDGLAADDEAHAISR